MRHNARGQHVPVCLWNVARRVHRLASRPRLLEWWRRQVLQWCEGDWGRTPAEYSPLPQALNLPEQCAVLAAVHDFAAEAGMELIGPHDGTESAACEPTPALKYAVLKVAVAECTEPEAKRLAGFARQIRKKLIPAFRFSPDFRAAVWGAQRFEFTIAQAACLSVMWRHRSDWLGPDYVLSQAAEYPGRSEAAKNSLERLQFAARLRDVFKGHPVWGRLIQVHPGKDGLFRLAPPPIPDF